MTARWLALALLCVVLAGCQAGPPFAAAPPTAAALDEPFALRAGESAQLADANLEVTFASVPADGRCPTNIQCAETAPVRVVVSVAEMDGADSSEFPFQCHTTQEGEVIATAPDTHVSEQVGPFEITLLRVTPYPDALQATEPGDYRIEVVVTRQASA